MVISEIPIRLNQCIQTIADFQQNILTVLQRRFLMDSGWTGTDKVHRLPDDRVNTLGIFVLTSWCPTPPSDRARRGESRFR
ncbi:hypothetical protein ACN4EK_31260 [Pantanalinema rosaneae CENA516]|uniref:hypothetical protein n=1 Tax=Pantanalinema rosaneae TaxID=1620701 RepID=UPI003D6E949A